MDRRLREQNVVQQVLESGERALCGLSRYCYMAILGIVIVLIGFTCQPARAQTSEWVWMGGSQTAGAAGVYGTQGVAAVANIPGARDDAFTWTDSSGNLWLFGGRGKDYVGTQGELNDLWEFNPLTNEWAWISGSKTANTSAVYGTQGVPSTSNIPGPRDSGVAWTDKNGNLWLFGGNGYDSTGKQGFLNDLWYYNPSTQEWTWVNGSNAANSTGLFGTQGVGSTSNFPSAREGEDSGGVLPGWTDNDGNLWLFGGDGEDSSGTVGSLNDLWEYSLASGMWTWVSGSKTANGSGVYGTQGVAGAGSTPSARQSAQAWTDKIGNFWLHGGYAPDVVCSTSTQYVCADSPEMWEFNPIAKEWTWISGLDSANAPPVYGTQGVASDTSNPSGREMAATWVDLLGNFWLFSGYSIDGQLNNGPADLWMYNTTTNQWNWVGGNTGNTAAVYGTLGVPAATNWPEAQGIEGASATWADTQGNLWLFSGSGNPNDLWVYHASPAATPTFSVPGGTYTTAQTVTISDATPGATIYYSTDGSTPTAKSTTYSGPVTVSATAAINAIAIAAGYPTSAVATAAYTITPVTASPTFTPAAGTYTSAQTVTITDPTQGATIYFTTDGSTPTTSSAVYSSPITVSTTETIQAIAVAAGYSASGASSATYTINIPNNPVPVITSLSPALATAGSAAFTLTVNGSSFSTGSTIYWNSTALTTNYVSATQLTAQVPASLIAAAGTSNITVQTPAPGGGTSNTQTFEIDSASSIVTPPSFSDPSATVAAGSSATYQVTLPSSATNVSVTCLNLPSGASCSYSASSEAVTITTSSTTPKGTFQIVVAFTETISAGTSAAYLLPFFLLPLALLRKRVRARGILFVAGAILVAVATLSTGCGGGGSGSGGTITTPTKTVTSSGAVSLTVQ